MIPAKFNDEALDRRSPARPQIPLRSSANHALNRNRE